MTEKQLEEKYLQKIITVNNTNGTSTTGKVESITIWKDEVIFFIGAYRFTMDAEYFTDENVTIHGYNERRAGDSDVFWEHKEED